MSMGTDNDGAQVDPAQKASGISLLKGILTLLGGASGATTVWGTTADAAVVTDTTGTISGKLRGLVKWAFERMPAALGQTTMAASLPVALASNQSSIPTTDAGPSQTLTRTYTASADMTTAAAISVAPTSGQKVVAVDILVSTDTAMNFSIQEETSATVFAKVFLPANGTAQITLRGYIKAAVADRRLFGDASVAGNVAITCVQFSEA